MERARLLERSVNIQEEKEKLLQTGHSLNDCIMILNEKYRAHSKKKVFICECCGSSVQMVIGQSDRVAHFRHDHIKQCPAQHNYEQYRSQRKKEAKHHRVKVIVLQEYLKSQNFGDNLTVSDGYLFREQLNMVPDIILQKESECYAIDFISGSKLNTGYDIELAVRQQRYQQQGFKPLFIFDESWLSVEYDKSYSISLHSAEKQVFMLTNVDEKWNVMLSSLIETYNKQSILPYFNYRFEGISVHNLMYLKTDQNCVEIVRYFPIYFVNQDDYYWGYMPHPQVKIPLSDALKIEGDSFYCSLTGDDDRLQQFVIQVQASHEKTFASQKTISAPKIPSKQVYSSNATKYVKEGDEYRRKLTGASESSSQDELFWRIRVGEEALKLCIESEQMREHPSMMKRVDAAKSIISAAYRNTFISLDDWRELYGEIVNLISFAKI